MLAKAPRLGADELVLDLEDSVAPGVKSDARNALAAFLQERPETPALAVRVNALDSHWFRDDVMVLVQRAGAAIDTLVLPKVESAADLEAVDGLLDDLGEPAARIPSQALIETAAGLLHAGEIAYASTPWSSAMRTSPLHSAAAPIPARGVGCTRRRLCWWLLGPPACRPSTVPTSRYGIGRVAAARRLRACARL